MATAKLTPLALAVLELLHEKPMHPYEMAQLMRDRHVDLRVKVKAGSLYHTVERLLGYNFVEVVDTLRDGRRPERTVYGMTSCGRDAFMERGRELLGDVAEEHPSYLSGLAVIDDIGRQPSLNELEHRMTSLRAALAADAVVMGQLKADKTPEIYWLDWRFMNAQRAFELEWTGQLIADLRSGRIGFPGEQTHLSLITKDSNNDHKTG